MARGRWHGKRVLVSGGSAGVGRAVGLQLAAEGADVCIAARGTAGLERTAMDMRAIAPPGTRIIPRSVDVCDYPAVARLADTIWAELGGLDLLLCNQGFAQVAAVNSLTAAEMERMLRVNFLGHAHLCKAFAPHLMKQGFGTVMLVSSVLGHLSFFGYSAYSASKWAIVGFAEGVRQELSLHGVDVKVAYFGTVETPGLLQENASKPRAVWEMESGGPFNRVRTAEDVARRLLVAARGSRFENPLGFDSKLTFWASRHLPGLVRWMSDRDLRAAMALHGAPDGVPEPSHQPAARPGGSTRPRARPRGRRGRAG